MICNLLQILCMTYYNINLNDLNIALLYIASYEFVINQDYKLFYISLSYENIIKKKKIYIYIKIYTYIIIIYI